MPVPDFIPAPSVTNVAIGATAIIRPEPVGTYFGLQLYYTRSGVAATPAQIASDIDLIRVMLEGVPQWEITGAQLQMLNATRGYVPSNGYLPLFFSEPWRDTEAARDLRSWGMLDISNFTIEVSINGAAVAPGLRCYPQWTQQEARMGEIRKFRRETVPIAVTGDNVITTFNPRDRILAMHCSSTIITAFKIKINGLEKFNAPVADYHEFIRLNGTTLVANWTHLHFDYRSRTMEALQPFVLSDSGPYQNAVFPIKQQLPFEVTFTTSAATPFTMVRELVGPRD
jgi:hypothetical protein